MFTLPLARAMIWHQSGAKTPGKAGFESPF
jgi:hypothetical protein